MEKTSTAGIGIELGRRQRRVLHLRLFLPEKITVLERPTRMEAATVDLNVRSFCAWRTIVAGYLRRADRDDQSGERDQYPEGSRAGC